MKALGLIADKRDTPRIINRLKSETDIEALTWGTAALLRTAGDRSMQELCAEAGLERSAPFWLAARLYAPDQWLQRHWQPTKISLHDEDVTLKWAIFLAGYGRAPPDMFDPKHENRVFLGKLNQHGSAEIAEYSTWALWQRPEFSFSDCSISAHDIAARPENVRKWLYQLIMKAPDGLVDVDMLHDFRREDASAGAREGIALGLARRFRSEFHQEALEWYDDESDDVVKATLLAFMAENADQNQDFAEIVTRRFFAAPIGDSLRRRLLVASSGTHLYGVLKRKDLEEDFARKGLFEYGSGSTTQIGVFQMGNTFNVKGDVHAQNLSGGDMHANAISAVQSVPVEQDRAVLTKVLQFSEQAQIPDAEKGRILNSVEVAAKEPSPETRNGVLAALTQVGELVGTVAGLTEIVDAVQKWLA